MSGDVERVAAVLDRLDTTLGGNVAVRYSFDIRNALADPETAENGPVRGES
jgi:hypothetical protein